MSPRSPRLVATALKLAGSLVLCLAFSSGVAAQEIKLRMTIWSANEAHLKLFNGIAEGFKAQQPNVSVSFEPLPFDNYTTALTTQIAGGNAPDMAWIFETSAYDFVNSGALYPLGKTLAATPGYAASDVAPSATERWTKDGTLYAYPFSTSPFGVFVNNDLIRQAGAKTPAELIAANQWTWPNAIASAQAVAAKTGKAGVVVRDFNYQAWQFLSSVYYGWGAAPWSADGKRCTFTDKPMVDALGFVHDAVFSKKAMPGPGQNVDFFAGDAAMTITQISRASLLPKDKPFDWDLVPLPRGPVGDYAIVGQAGVGVLKQSKNAEMAAKFVAYMTNPDNSTRLAQYFPSARRSLLNVETLGKTNARLNPTQLDKVVVAGISSGKLMPGHTDFARLQQMVRAGLDPVWQPQADIPAAMKSICAQIGPLLAK